MNPPPFSYAKKYKIWKKCRIFTSPTRAYRSGKPGCGEKKIWEILQNIQNMQNIMFWKGMFLCLFASCIHSTTSGSMCRSTQQWCRGHVRSADCIQVRPVFVRQCTTSSSAQSIASSVLVITKQRGKNLVAPIAFYASKPFLDFFRCRATHCQFLCQPEFSNSIGKSTATVQCRVSSQLLIIF